MNKALVFSLLLPVASASAATFVLSDENFDTTPVSGNGLNTGNANVTLSTTVGDPTGTGSGNVGSADIAPGGRWGEVRTQLNSIGIPAESTPGADTFTFSMDVYVPSDTTFAATDRIGIILRWNDNNTANTSQFRAWDSFTPNTWETMTLTGPDVSKSPASYFPRATWWMSWASRS